MADLKALAEAVIRGDQTTAVNVTKAALKDKMPPPIIDPTVRIVAKEIEENTRDFIIKQLAQEIKGHAFAEFDAEVAERFFLTTRGDRVIEFLAFFVEHQQGPQLGIDRALHVIEDGAQDRIQIEA